MGYETDLERISSRMTAEDRKFYADIFAPTVVAAPDADPWGNLCVMPDGEIRVYGTYRQKNVFQTDAQRDYLSSADGGLSWKRHLVEEPTALGASVYVPFLEKYVVAAAEKGRGTFLLMGNSPEDPAPEKIRISDTEYEDLLPPVVLRQRDRILLIGHERRPQLHPTAYFAVLMYADRSLREWHTVPLKPAPMFAPQPPHKGGRWQQNNRENTIAELSDGRLMMLSRTAMDYHFVSYSEDGGEHWSDPVPSVFHGTATMPKLLRLSDGRLLFFWCNTHPLPEREDADGVWEDVFTNRDAVHAAISEDDGKSWIGFRELELNPYRNAPDFRSVGGGETGRDKSVHQMEAMELPGGKVMVSCGQHALCRKILIFDLQWLYEKKRNENFLHGMQALSTQGYIRSVLGCFRGSAEDPDSFVGHCAYNRVSSAFMVPSPANDGREVLQICHSDDPRLLNNVGGAVWNFPAARRGSVRIRLCIQGEGLRISLLDQWVNPTDEDVRKIAHFSAPVTAGMLFAKGIFDEIRLDFDCDSAAVSTFINGKYISKGRLHGAAPNGLCYLHLQSLSAEPDYDGAMIAELSYEGQ